MNGLTEERIAVLNGTTGSGSCSTDTAGLDSSNGKVNVTFVV